MIQTTGFPAGRPVLLECPAWAPIWRCKSSPKLTTAREVKRKGVRVTERLKEGWSIILEPTNRNLI